MICIDAGDINLPEKHCCATLNIFRELMVTCRWTTHTECILAFPVQNGCAHAPQLYLISTLLILLYVECFFSPWLYVIYLHFSHDRSNWTSPSFSSTTFQNFPGISDLLSEMSKVQHHTKLCSKCSISLASYLNWNTICWWNESSCWILLLSRQSWIEDTGK